MCWCAWSWPMTRGRPRWPGTELVLRWWRTAEWRSVGEQRAGRWIEIDFHSRDGAQGGAGGLRGLGAQGRSPRAVSFQQPLLEPPDRRDRAAGSFDLGEGSGE